MLLQRTRDCLALIKDAEKAKGGLEEAEVLATLHTQLQRETSSFNQACVRAMVVRSAGIPLVLSPDIEQQRIKIENTARRFKEKPQAATLKQGNRWPALLTAIGESSRALNLSLEGAWRNFVNSKLFAGPPPEEEERSLDRTPLNKRVLGKYRILFDEFRRLRSSAPSQPVTIRRLMELSEELAKVATQFQRNVPASVSAFLTATNSSGGAGLLLFNDEVRNWLTENGLLESYVIRARLN